MMNDKRPHIGRFAPSPSGPLHLGSLCTALGSYVFAKQHEGQWLLRIEDIDEPRSVAGADQKIMQTLVAHGMQWDKDVWYQSHRKAYYQALLEQIVAHTYFCDCTRAQIRARGDAYDGFCRHKTSIEEPRAVRFKHDSPRLNFNDLRLGQVTLSHAHSSEDFVIKRRDGLFAYNFVVVADDIAQGISHIVRGADLLDTTPCHLALYEAFNQPKPEYVHLPLVCFSPQQKLSKQNHAPAVEDSHAVKNLHTALSLLGSPPPQDQDLSSVSAILEWAIQNLNVSENNTTREVIVERG